MSTLDLQSVIANFPVAVRAKYDFSKAVYHGATLPMTGIVCPEHGEFQQYSGQLRKGGAGCPTCGDISRRANQRGTRGGFETKAREVHGDRYDYSKSVYVSSKDKLIVTCDDHGDFLISPNNHISGGKGCPSCGRRLRGRNKTPRSTHAPRLDRERIADEWATQNGIPVHLARELSKKLKDLI